MFEADASAYGTDRSGRPGAAPLGVVKPGGIAQIEALVRWANKERVPLVPVSSRGGPRRRGDTISPVPALIVDLGALNRVVHADGRDAIALIEPGVTFDELDTALEPHGLRSFRPLLPRASKSVLGAFLEREPITVPGHHWDSADPLAAFELVFGSGDCFRTGGASLPGTVEENLKRGNRQMQSAGPGHTDFGRVIQGAQGSLAIVARASILCQRKPAVTVPLFVSAETLAPVVATAYEMLRARLDGQLFLVNAPQLALMTAADPVGFSIGKAALPRWILYIELTAPGYFSDEAIAYLRADLEAAAGAAGARVTEAVGAVSAAGLASRLRRSAEGDFRDRLGAAHQEVFFVSQLNRAERQLEVLDGLVDVASVPVYIQPMTHGVNAHIEVSLFADTPPAAIRLARASAKRFADAGAFFSRPYHPWADLPFVNNDAITPLLAKTKNILDPNGILQPRSQALGHVMALEEEAEQGTR